jgi:HTH-type transcriptional regulator / antitoxin HipB
MSDLQKYIGKRKKTDLEFAKDYNEGFEEFKIGLILRQEREKSVLIQ